MNVAAVLEFLRSELVRRSTDIISLADLASLGAVERCLFDASVADIGSARAVAWVASLTPSADREAFRQEFGDGAAVLLETLVPAGALNVPAPRGLGRLNLWTTWARTTSVADAERRKIATALLVGETEKITQPEEWKSFKGMLDIAIASAPDAATRATIAAIPCRVVQPASAGSIKHPMLISLSMDVVGSTEAKQRLRDLAANEQRRDQLYEQFYAGFLRAEGRFYAALFAPGIAGSGPPLDWHRLFVVKGIGDEVWLLYEVVPPQGIEVEPALQQAATRLISAALELTQQRVQCGGTAEDIGPGFDPEREKLQSFDWMELPLKVSIDLVEDAVEISKQRLDYLADQAALYIEPPQTAMGLQERAPFSAAHTDILRRLNAGHFELAGGHQLRQAYRTDYIGPDIDRFFRITKYAMPGMVMVGDCLLQRLRFNVQQELAPGIDRILFEFPFNLHYPNSYVATSEAVVRRRRTIAPGEMKGIKAPYIAHQLIKAPTLRAILHEVDRNPFLKLTAGALPIGDLIAPTAIHDDLYGDDVEPESNKPR